MPYGCPGGRIHPASESRAHTQQTPSATHVAEKRAQPLDDPERQLPRGDAVVRECAAGQQPTAQIQQAERRTRYADVHPGRDRPAVLPGMQIDRNLRPADSAARHELGQLPHQA